jgi:glycosyltransferase involved in cell wall biosynthesis
VLAQDFQDLELIVVDDGSEPSLRETVEAFNDKRIKYYRLESNRGLHAARAFAVEQSIGEFVALLDDDDYWLPEKISKQMRLIKSNSQTGMVCSGAIDEFPDCTQMLRLPQSKQISYKQEAVYECTIASSVLFRRSAYEEIGGFDEQLRRCGDWECWIRLARAYNIKAIMEPLVVTRMTPGSLQRSSDVEDFAQDRLKVLKKHEKNFKVEGLWDSALSWQYHSVGVRYFRTGQLSKARKWLLKAAQKKLQIESLALYAIAWPLVNKFYTTLRRLRRSYKCIRRAGLNN